VTVAPAIGASLLWSIASTSIPPRIPPLRRKANDMGACRSARGDLV